MMRSNSPVVEVTRLGTVVLGTGKEIGDLNTDFRRQHFVLLPGLLQPGLLDLLSSRLEAAVFQPRVHGEVGVELCLSDSWIEGLLGFLANNVTLFEVMEAITGCETIGCFGGRVYRMMPGKDHYEDWHNDMGDARLLGMTVNLGNKPFAGGRLEIRHRFSQKMISRIQNTGLGDAVIFRLADYLQHRITEVQGTVPKTAFAGWFKSEPDFFAQLKKSSRSILTNEKPPS
jgi:hypothetical protein